jgi:hypothetical protein
VSRTRHDLNERSKNPGVPVKLFHDDFTPVGSIQPREVFSVARKILVIEVDVENTEQISFVCGAPHELKTQHHASTKERIAAVHYY